MILTDLPPAISAFVKDTDGFYTIVINARLSAQKQRAAYREELRHIARKDFDSDMTADQIEREAHG